MNEDFATENSDTELVDDSASEHILTLSEEGKQKLPGILKKYRDRLAKVTSEIETIRSPLLLAHVAVTKADTEVKLELVKTLEKDGQIDILAFARKMIVEKVAGPFGPREVQDAIETTARQLCKPSSMRKLDEAIRILRETT